MDYKKSADQIYKQIGGSKNIISAAHCATRMRLVLADESIVNQKEIENIDGVKGIFIASGQLQIILGTGTVNKVFEEFSKVANITQASKDEVKQMASSKQNIMQRLIKTLGDVFVPVIPAIVASGLLMGLLDGLSKMFPELATSGTFTIISLFSNASFVFLPILIAMSSAKVFGGNVYLGAVIGMIMIHPNLLNAWSVASVETIPTASAWFGLYDINLVGYQGHVIPVVIAVWLMSVLEKKIRSIVPEMLDLFITPLLTVLITGYVTLTAIGPVFSGLENYVLEFMQYLITIPYGIGASLAGAMYGPTVVAGVHHMYNALEAGLISATGVNIWMPIATAANVAQGGAALAVALKTKDQKIKSLALPSALSAFMGITEPAIFGVNLRFFKPFVAGIIGGAVGALFASIMNISATAYGITGIFGLLITTNYIVPYLLTMAISAGVAFAISWVLHKEKADETNTEQTNSNLKIETKEVVIFSPLVGKAIELKEVSDKTFAQGILGKGLAVIPTEGTLISPVNATVTLVYETKHAVALTTDDGVELLIHIGIDTVNLNGEHFESFIEEGQRVQIGDLLIKFDIDKIKQAGYLLDTPIIVANTDDFKDIIVKNLGEVNASTEIIEIAR